MLQQHKPSQVGLVYRCAACNAPVFLRFTVKLYAGSRVELAPNFVELERAREKFNFTYLPEDTEALLKEAFACFTAACYNAFASMCRRVAQRTFADLGADGKLELYDELANVRRLAEIDERIVRGREESAVRFRRAGPRQTLPVINAFQAGVLLEVLKDLLYQAYVRRGRLQQAMMVRRYFAEDGDEGHAAARRATRSAFDSADPDPGIPEHPHPAAVLAGCLRVPGILHRAEDALRVRHQDRDPSVPRRVTRGTLRRAVGIRRVARRDLPAVVDKAQHNLRVARPPRPRRFANSARPSPWATAIGNCDPAMPAKKSEFVAAISTIDSRPSNCSERFRRKRGQCAAPGISSASAASIWQPLHTPSVKRSCRREPAPRRGSAPAG